MLELIPGRQYIFRSEIGVHIGVFVGKAANGMKFENCVCAIAVGVPKVKVVDADRIMDAEEYLQSIVPVTELEGVNPDAAKEFAAEVKGRHAKAVTIKRATPRSNW